MISPNPIRPSEKIIIAGAGPSGLLLAILLAQHNIPSVVFEAWDRLDERLRATQYGVPATRVFRRAGLLDDFRAVSIGSFPSICWRHGSSHERLTGIDLSVVADHPDRMVVLPLNRIIQIMYKHCIEKTNGLVEVKFNNKVIDIGQNTDQAWVDVEHTESSERQRYYGDYVIGCDGASSTVRRLLFGRHWPGKTFDCKLLVQNIFYDGFERHGWDGGNYMIDEDNFGLIAKRGKGGLWRITYGDLPGLTEDEYKSRRPAILQKLLPGHPGPDEYRIEQNNSYNTHNRCVDTMRVGRILLAGDAAHINNPFGGYGCMTAVLDVGGLAECLIGIYEGKASDDILDKYATIRRQKYIDYVDTRSIKNMNRIWQQSDDDLLQTDKFLGILKDLEGDKDRTKQFLLKTSSIEHDFTQYYTQQSSARASFEDGKGGDR